MRDAARLVAEVPEPQRSIELRVIGVVAAQAGLEPPSESMLRRNLRICGEARSAAAPLAHLALINHLRMRSDPRTLEECRRALEDLAECEVAAIPDLVFRRWADPLAVAAVAEQLRIYGQVLLGVAERSTVERGRRLIEAGFEVAERSGRSTLSQRCWYRYILTMVHLEAPVAAATDVRPGTMELWRTRHADAALRLAELAVLQFLAGRWESSRATCALAEQAGAATGNEQAIVPVVGVTLALAVVDHPGDQQRVAEFRAVLELLLDDPNLAQFHPVFAAEFGLLLLGQGDLDGAASFADLARSVPAGLFSDVFSLTRRRLDGLLELATDPSKGRARLLELHSVAEAQGRRALVDRLDRDLAASPDVPGDAMARGRPARVDRPPVLIGALGPCLEVDLPDATAIALQGRPAELLALLVAADGATTVDAAIEHLWPEADPRVGRNRLHGVLLRLRRALGLGPDGPISCRDDVIRLDASDGVRVDAWEVAEGLSSDDPPTLLEAVDAYCGPVLSTQFAYDDRVVRYRRRLHARWVEAATRLLKADLEEPVVARIQRRLADDEPGD